MGNSETIFAFSVTDPRSISLGLLEKVQELEHCKIWRNKLSRQQFEEYIVSNKSKRSLVQEIAVYERRRQQAVSLVNIHYVENISKEEHGNFSDIKFRVLTQRIPTTLKEIKDLPLASGLLMLRKAFSTYIGYFKIFDDYMGVNKQNQPKFWLNPCWACNNVSKSTEQNTNNSTNLQGNMVQNIFNVVQSHTNQEEMTKYKQEKNKIEQWTFQLASTFIEYFIKNQGINQVVKITYVRKFTQQQNASQNKQKIRRQFSLKDPMYTLNTKNKILDITLMKVSISPIKQDIPSRKLHDSTTQLCFKKSQDIINKSHKQQDQESTRSIGIRSFANLAGLQFKRGSIRKNKNSKRGSSLARSTYSHKKDSNPIMNFKQKRKLLEDKIKDLKSQKQVSQKAFTVGKYQQSFADGQQNVSVRDSNIESKWNFTTAEKNIETKSVVSNSQVLKFKTQKNNERKDCVQKSQNIGPSKVFEIDFGLMQQNIFQNETTQSTGFYTPMAKPRHLFPKSRNIQTTAGIVFSQISQKGNLQESTGRTPMASFPSLFKKDKQQKGSGIIGQSNMQIPSFLEKYEGQTQQKVFLSQSITMDQPMIQLKKNNKPLSMLDTLMVKKVIEKIQGQENCQQRQKRISNIMVESIIQPFSQSTYEPW